MRGNRLALNVVSVGGGGDFTWGVGGGDYAWARAVGQHATALPPAMIEGPKLAVLVIQSY